MEKSFIKEIKVLEKIKVDIYKELMGNIDSVKKNLERDYKNMQFVHDKDLMDYYTYKIKAEEAQYDFLIREAKRVEMKNVKK